MKRITPEDIASSVVMEHLGSGETANVYKVRIAYHAFAVKQSIYPRSVTTEVCMQRRAYRHGISPDVISVWKCNDTQAPVIVMDLVRGSAIHVVLEQQPGNIFALFWKVLLSFLTLNLEARVLHGDPQLNNIIVDGERVTLIDYGNAKNYPYDKLVENASNPVKVADAEPRWNDPNNDIGMDIYRIASFLGRWAGRNRTIDVCMHFHQFIEYEHISYISTLINLHKTFYHAHGRIAPPHELLQQYQQLAAKYIQ